MDWDKVESHVGHEIEIVTYGPNGEVWNVSIECLTCGEVVGDSESDGLAQNALVNAVRADAQ